MTVRVGLQLFPATLASSKLVNKKMRQELAALSDEPLDLSELAIDYRRAHNALMALLLSFYTPRLEEMAHYAAAVYRRFEIPHDAAPVIWEGDHPESGLASQRRAIMTGFDEMLRAFALRERLNAEIAA
ncbi:hypothetical protein M527_15495 [Sphingobium indicum IP26]|uniref:Uncharacterized protein n=1 Tax=Sphingobium indicum F2 TaxID=1450518 RepID=A0A8E0WPX4_9SPHN|nr:hypothetical protein [Sphingobium indicum]EPR17736.1 hypothetical protein M527_15495 [Sphingobium indicum IP26]KER35253.1 hypothetical protein AL00_16845 [Sphingobium indicum F2]